MIAPTINVDGLIRPAQEASIPVLDRGFLYGDSVYEVFRTYRGVPLFLDDHFERLENSARLIQMQISQSREELLLEIKRTAKIAGVKQNEDAYVRYQITRGA
jgi:branched-chain amino acid aminotransferase